MKKELSVYVIAYFVLLLFVLGLQCVYPKLELHLMLNSCHTEAQDFFFKYYSTFAEWLLYILALLPLFWKRAEMTILFAASEIMGGCIVQILKHSFRYDRPVTVFENFPDMVLPLVQGVEMRHSNSFPSGHTSTFFIFFTCCAIILAYEIIQRNKELNRKTLCLIQLSTLGMLFLAALGAYSRVYLSQHFMWDITIGSIIGFVTPFLVFHFGKDKILKLKNKLYNIRNEEFSK